MPSGNIAAAAAVNTALWLLEFCLFVFLVYAVACMLNCKHLH